MSDGMRWAMAIVTAALLVALIAYGRGTAHHRGIDVGVHASGASRIAG